MQNNRQIEALSKISGEEADFFHKLADSYYNLGNFQKALQYYLKAVKNISEDNATDKLAVSYSKIGNTFWHLSDYENSLVYHRKALQIFQKKNLKKNIAQTQINLGNVHQSLNNFEDALHHFHQALKIYEELDNKYGIGIIYNNMGTIFLSMKKNPTALDYFLKALKIFEKINYRKGAANSLNNIGAIFYQQQDYEQALSYFEKALPLLRETGSKNGIATALNNIADVYADSDRISEALSYFSQALQLEEEIGDKYGISLCFKNIANLKIRQKKWNEAQQNLQKSLEIATEIEAIDLNKDIYLAFAEFFSRRNDFQNAFIYYKKFSDLKDKIFDVESQRKLSELQVKYETEKKEKEAEIFRLQNIVLEDANKRLKKEIGQRKQAQEALKMSEKKFRSLFETASEFIFIMDGNLKIMEINPAVQIESGFSAAEMSGKRISDFLTEDCQRKFADFVKQNIHKYPNPELKFIRKDGSEIIMDCSVSTIRDRSKNLLFHYAFLRDITRKKEIERMKNEFVSQVSHELRSPLASIKGFTSTIIQDDEMDAETRNYFLSIIDSESDRLSRLIENLLDISKIESGYIKMNFVENPIQETVSLALAHISPLAQAKQIKLHSKLPSESLKIVYDNDKIFQVLTNLLSNAIKFTPETGKVEISVRKNSVGVEIIVADSGIGIPKKDLDNIFKKFFRVEGPEIKVRGTGLGLAIVKEIVQSHHGKISVESELGKGTKFRVTIPGKVKYEKKYSDS